MTQGFRRAAGRGVVIELSRDEAVVLRSMADLLLELVEPPETKDGLSALVGIGENADPPEDPVLARLFPDAYTEPGDTEAASDFRRYTEDSLREGKRAGAESILAATPESGGRVELGEEQALTWLKSLNDVRIALGTRLGVDEETLHVDHGDGEDPDTAALHIYDWLTGLQESLVQAMR